MRRVAESVRDCLAIVLRAMREEQELSTDQMAARMGRGQSTVSRIETGDVDVALVDVIRAGLNVADLVKRAEEVAAGWGGLAGGRADAAVSAANRRRSTLCCQTPRKRLRGVRSGEARGVHPVLAVSRVRDLQV